MSVKKNSVKVMIGGEEYTVRSDLTPEYTREVAGYLDQALKKVLAQGGLVRHTRPPFSPLWTSRTNCSKLGRVNGRSPRGSRPFRTTWRSCSLRRREPSAVSRS